MFTFEYDIGNEWHTVIQNTTLQFFFEQVHFSSEVLLMVPLLHFSDIDNSAGQST